MTWDKVDSTLPRSDKLKKMIIEGYLRRWRKKIRNACIIIVWRLHGVKTELGYITNKEVAIIHAHRPISFHLPGIPHSLRPQIWMRTSGALQKKLQSDLSYKDIVKNSSHEHLMTSKQIEKVGRWKQDREINQDLPGDAFNQVFGNVLPLGSSPDDASQRLFRQFQFEWCPATKANPARTRLAIPRYW